MAKKGQNLQNAIDGVNGLPGIDWNSSTREMADALIEGQPDIPDPSGVALYGSSNEYKQYIDLQTISRANAFICSGGGNAYILTTDTGFHLRQFTYLKKYSRIRFTASFTNTASCTIKLDFCDAKAVKLSNGNAISAGYITAGNVYTIFYNGTDWILENPTIQTSYTPHRIILSNNATNPNTQIDFSTGNFVFNDDSGFATLSAITGDLSLNFGTGIGMLDTGTKAINTWYYCYAIYNPTTMVSKVICSLSDSLPLLPSGYTKYEYIGSIKTKGDGNIIKLKQTDKDFILDVSILDLPLTYMHSTAASVTLSTPKNVIALCYVSEGISQGTGLGDVYGLFTNLNQTDTIPSASCFHSIVYGGAIEVSRNVTRIEVLTNALSQIRTRFSVSSVYAIYSIVTIGWRDTKLR